MNKSKNSYIQVTKKLDSVITELADRIYEKQGQGAFNSPDEIQNWMKYQLTSILYPADASNAVIKYHEPKIQFTKSGPLGDASYAISNQRQHYARRKPVKPYRPTPARLTQQHRMRQAILAWQQLAPEVQSQWKSATIISQFHMQGVYLFRGVYITLLITNQPIPEPFLPTPDILQFYKNYKSQ